jgi:GT2 family glycosyltransferase/lipopolysaccharide/colanic/teichoic acid biosynthesis glycosyltransferase
LIDLSVIIVNYNVKELLDQCIESIIKASLNIKTEIIIVDNNSYDGSAEYIRKKYSENPYIKLIESNINLGFSKANNLGVKHASGEYILILNPDTLTQEDTLDKSLKYIKSNNDVGALTCKLILPNGKLDLACRRSFPTPSVAVYRILGLSKIFPKSKIFGKYNLTYLDENKTYEVDAIVGAFMLMKRELYEKLNGFDEDYFMYGEDLDLCYRIKKAGYKIIYYPETSIIHYKGESTKKSSTQYVKNFYGAMQTFVKKNLNTNFWLMNFLIRVSIIYRSLISYIKRFIQQAYPALIDLALIVIGMIIAIYQRFEFFPLKAYTLVIFVYSIVWMITLYLSGSYNRENKFSLIKPFYGILLGFFVNSSITYFFNEYAFSRAVILRTVFNAYLLMALWRIIVKLVIYSKSNGLFKTVNTLIIGRNSETDNFISNLKKRVDNSYEILGYISPSLDIKEGYIGNLNNLKDIIVSKKVKTIIFAKNVLSNRLILDLMWELKDYNLDYKILTTDSDIILGKDALDKVNDIYLLQIEYNINKKFNIFVKRLFDLIFGIINLISIYPLVMIISKIPSIYNTRIKYFDKIKLIPKVIKGEYSFVGLAQWDNPQHGIQFLGKKGLTGLVQINLYKELSQEEIEYYNFYYAKNQTLILDLEILLKTLSLFIFRKDREKI